MGACAPLTSLGSPFIVKKIYIKKNCISVLRLSAFDMVLWVEGPPFVDSCGIFWTKLCDSRLISMIHSHLMSFTFTCLVS